MAQRKALVSVVMPLLALGVAIVVAFESGVLRTVRDQVQELAVSGTMGGNGKQIPVETLDRGQMGPWQGEMAIMVQSPEDWSGVMSEGVARGEIAASPSAPSVDWKKQTVVLVSLGQQSTHGWSVEIAGAERKGNKLVLDVVKTRPAGSNRIMTICAPYHLVCMESPGVKELVIEERWETQGAGTTAQTQGAGIEADSTKSTTWGDIKQKYTTP